MFRRYAILMALMAALSLGWAEEMTLAGDWWRAAATADRHTTLVGSFDNGDDADAARELTGSGGFGMKPEPAGAHGAAVQVAAPGGHLHFRGGSNIQHERGTVRFAVKGDVWKLAEPRWLFDARGLERLGIMREPGKLSLVRCEGGRTDAFLARLDLPTGEVSTDAWHWIMASWDGAAGKAWLALDGRGVSGDMSFSADRRPPFVIYLGSAGSSRPGGLNFPPLAFDDFVLYDLPLPQLEAPARPLPEEEAVYLPVVEQGIRQTLGFMADLQRWGGWQTLYTWPTLLGSTAQGRDYVDFDDYVDNDKGNASCPVAAKFLWAYETLGDARFLDVALRTGEFVLAAQAPEGYWVHGYRMTVHGISPAASPANIKLQDRVQAHPIQLLAYLHRLTGDERYLKAIQRAGEFYLLAQNPNGSFPHHYDLPAKQGENATGIAGGGELNDLATNDGIDTMALLFHVTGDARYVRAMKRAGDWLLQAQGKQVPLWADQYDGENNPAWARAFEPPAYSVGATGQACQALREMVRFSGDARYLEGIKRADTWIKANLPDGQMSDFVDVQSGRPIAAWDRKIYFLDEPASLEFLKTVPIGSGYLKKLNIGATVARTLQQAEGAAPTRAMMTAESALKDLPALRGSAKVALDSRNQAGVWTVPIVADYMGSLGEGFAGGIYRMANMIAYVEAARIAAGELEPRYAGSSNLLLLAYPLPDWYDVKWQESLKP